MRYYPNPDYKRSEEPIGTGKSKWWFLGARFKKLFRPSAAHDAAYELKKMGYLWHEDSKDADHLWLEIYNNEIDSLPFFSKYLRKVFSRFARRVMTRYGRKNWPQNRGYGKTAWGIVKLDLETWWIKSAPRDATPEQKFQMMADVKFRYWRYE